MRLAGTATTILSVRPRSQESITLNKSGDAYTGTFIVDFYDPNGTLLVELKGNVTAARITVNTTIQQVL